MPDQRGNGGAIGDLREWAVFRAFLVRNCRRPGVLPGIQQLDHKRRGARVHAAQGAEVQGLGGAEVQAVQAA